LQGVGEFEYVNQQTWWPGTVIKKSDWSSGEDEGVGFTEDATRHLETLRSRGVITQAVKTAKPELLLSRLLRIFTKPGDLVLEVFGESGDLAAVATKLNRRWVLLAGGTDQEREILRTCAFPRIKGVMSGCDAVGEASSEGDDGEGDDDAPRVTKRKQICI